MRENEAVDVFWHDDCLRHDTGRGVFSGGPSELLEEPAPHPENAQRLRNMRSILRRGPIAAHLRWRVGRHAEPEELEPVHPASYVEEVRRFGDGVPLEGMLPASPGTYDAALASAGTTLVAADAVLSGESKLAYALVRPPGHHAMPAHADGYCLFNNVALAAEAARRAGRERVAILDWDVHHGNGTQDCFWQRGDVLTVSIHMDHGPWAPWHPHTGRPDERGAGDGEGFNVNVALPYGIGDEGYGRVLEEVVVPLLEEYRPDLLLVASGQDASQFDPNGRQCLTMEGFRMLGRTARELADRHCGGRLLLVQEGGYEVGYAAYCLHSTLEGVLGLEPRLADDNAYLPDTVYGLSEALDAIRRALGPYWPLG
jgi:acetoin utilization deacetylase AcuC-like enzyme